MLGFLFRMNKKRRRRIKMVNPLGGGTQLAPNCGVDSGSPAAVSGSIMWGTRDPNPTVSGSSSINALHAGMVIRTGIMWEGLDPSLSGNGPFNWSKIDNLVNIRSGCKWLIVIKGGPSGTRPNKYPGDAYVTPYANFCAALVNKYNAPSIYGVEFYNEPNLALWTGTQVGRIAAACANAIAPINAAKPAASRIKVIVGVWSGNENMRTPTQRIIDFYNTIVPVKSKIDMVSYHPYHRHYPPELTSREGPAGMQFQMQQVISSAAAHGYDGNFAATEFGWTTMPTDGSVINYVPEAYSARYCVRQMIMMFAHGAGKFQLIVQFQMFGTSTPTIEEGGLGMVRCSTDKDDNGNIPGAGTLKPLYYGYKTMASIIDETSTSATPITTPDPTTNAVFRYRYDKTGGKYGWVFWTVPLGAVTALTLNGLPSTVRKTLQGGAQSMVTTTGGSLTVNATNDVTYIDAVW